MMAMRQGESLSNRQFGWLRSERKDMDHTIDDSDRLKPCPFCDGAALSWKLEDAEECIPAAAALLESADAENKRLRQLVINAAEEAARRDSEIERLERELLAARAESEHAAQERVAERERILRALPGGHSVDPQWVADLVRGEA